MVDAFLSFRAEYLATILRMPRLTGRSEWSVLRVSCPVPSRARGGQQQIRISAPLPPPPKAAARQLHCSTSSRPGATQPRNRRGADGRRNDGRGVTESCSSPCCHEVTGTDEGDHNRHKPCVQVVSRARRGGSGASASPHSKQLKRSAWKPAMMMTVDSRHGTQTK